ncbi:MAG TPA: hypothetical protein VNT75_01245, partial [Symbiobacteriaceae bacterium]|nr:hypothetical protein [Symbiobacteriaceae bacterium]
MNLAVERYDDFSAVLSVWQKLLEADPNPTFFSTPAWLMTWWQHHREGRDLLLLVIRKDAAEVGFAPLMIEPISGGKSVLFLGSGLSDYADILVDESRVERRAAVCAVLDYLAAAFPSSLFDLQEIPAESPTVGLLAEWLKERGVSSAASVQDVCPVITLPDTAEAYHKQLKKSFLADIRRGER